MANGYRIEYDLGVTQREQASVITTDLLEANTLFGGHRPMSTITLPATDPRGAKAVAIATDAGQWLKCRTRDGRKAYGIQSSLGDGCYYLVTRTTCTCYDARERHNECKHMLAVQLHCQLVAERSAATKYDDIFTRFEQDDRPLPTPDLSRILGGPAPYVTNHVGEDDEPEPLCGPLCSAYTPDRERVCAKPAYHTGAHGWVLRTERED